jgi:4-carboxymuconolactone decarboxylase
VFPSARKPHWRSQEWQGTQREIKEGDVVWTPPGVKHWHGATATSSMTHIAIQEAVDSRNVTWLEQVTDAQYEQVAAPTLPRQQSPMKTSDDVRTVSPALERYATATLDGLWKRPALSPRDRSLVRSTTETEGQGSSFWRMPAKRYCRRF